MHANQTRRVGVVVAALLVGAGAVALAQPSHDAKPQPGHESPKPMDHAGAKDGHVMLAPGDLKWGPGPDSLPPGCEVAVLEGDLGGPGPFTIRAKMPAGYKVAAHTHPGVEHVTVLSGSAHMGLGEKLDTSKGTALPKGGFAVMPVGVVHYFWTDEATEIQVHGMGPFGITYVDPATDPRNAVKK